VRRFFASLLAARVCWPPLTPRHKKAPAMSAPILISACLLGAPVRYDGEHCRQDHPWLRALADAGASMVLMECVPAALAGAITAELPVPTIGIGAGPEVSMSGKISLR
jgi:uncharacterized protein YbbK (DUF523 family)